MTDAWTVISNAASATRQQERVKQQGVFRLVEALKKEDDVMFHKLLEMGVTPDAPLYLVGEYASPSSKDLLEGELFENYPFEFFTPLGFAALTDNVAAMKKLIRAGADISFPGPAGRDALWMALLSNSINAWDFLKSEFVNQGLSIPFASRSSDGKRTTRLMDAVVKRNVNVVRDLLGNVPLDAYDHTGRTALHYNFLQDPYTEADIQIGQMLISYGAPVKVEDHEGVSPAAMAQKPEQSILIDRAVLAEVTMEAHARAQAQRNQLEAEKPTPAQDPSEPAFPQIQKPVRFKVPKM